MFNVPQTKLNEFGELFKIHQMQVSGWDVYFQNIKMIIGRHRILDRDTYVKYYKNFTWDIPFESSPIDVFVPYDGEDETENEDIPEERRRKKSRLFTVNQMVPEYERLAKRITSEELHSTLPATHPVIMALDKNEVSLEDVIDDIFIYYSLYKYLEQMEQIRVKIFINYTPVIEWTVENIGEDVLRGFLSTNRINIDKVKKHSYLLFNRSDYDIVCTYYREIEDTNYQFDLGNFVEKLMSNIVLKTDIYIILAIYLTASFAIADIKDGNESPCTKYVKDVIVKNHFDV